MTQVIYRKYRPQTFAQLVNQKAVVQTLTNALQAGRIAHAYLFSGPRGTGKTTTARLLAKALNCEHPKGVEPDDSCDICKEIRSGHALDIIEIDAASNRGIDDVRRLKEEIRFGPQRLTYKMFILDEAHMLTRDASNALLKSLEEPPSHTIFVLATTEVHKLLPTIISRCQRLDFHTFTLKDIIGRLKYIAKEEKMSVDDRALKAIAVNAKGSLRDAESLLGKVFGVASGHEITYEEVRVLLGIVDVHLAVKLISILSTKDAAGALTFIGSIMKSGLSAKEFLRTFIEYLRKLTLVRTDISLSVTFKDELTKEELSTLGRQAKLFTQEQLLGLLDICMGELNVVEYYPLEQMALEMVVVRYVTQFAK